MLCHVRWELKRSGHDDVKWFILEEMEMVTYNVQPVTDAKSLYRNIVLLLNSLFLSLFFSFVIFNIHLQ